MWITNSEHNDHIQLVNIINNLNLSHAIRNNAWSKISELNVHIYNDRPSMRDEMRELAELSIKALVAVLESGKGLAISVSFGKDSNCCLALSLEAIKRFKRKYGFMPACYVINSNTTIENPALDDYFNAMQQSLNVFIKKHDLDVTFIEVHPDTTSHWHYVTIGRGKMPRYPGMTRDCSVDLKVKPIKKAKKALAKLTNELVSVVGTRMNESEERKQKMMDRGDVANTVLTGEDGDLVILPICDWEVDDVWALLTYCDSSSENALYHSFAPSFDETIDIYRSANSGECALNVGDKGQSAACGARFGCIYCLVSGDKDKSLTAMIDSDPERFSYLAGVNKLRDFMYAIRWDMDRRDWLGRSFDSDTGYYPLQPVYFSYETRLEILRYMLTLDAQEREWANQFNSGIVRFELVNYQQLIEIDLAWSLYSASPHAFTALLEYHEIHNCGKRYEIGEIVAAPKVSIPAKRWIKLPDAKEISRKGERHNRDGLSDPQLIEMARETGMEIPTLKDLFTGQQKEIVPFTKSKVMEVPELDAALFVEMFCSELSDTCKQYDSSESVFYYLSNGLVQLSGTQPTAFNAMLQLSQHWLDFKAHVATENLTEYAMKHSISDREHKLLKNETTIGDFDLNDQTQDEATDESFESGLLGFEEQLPLIF
ncbi:phosphoadenosine phosphosulfate reductase domain-containing protein [Photobacterium leiognathi]|uniref:phosphoadenosine phosphosulfate reductase domain-containing protein n=1 Tax=Photobacterium leiognathi TaxID=553611 RepID=UPI0029824729|nr:phosphoadenosine phosphosulfate reductase family protein [Photobacterium leiognathi]